MAKLTISDAVRTCRAGERMTRVWPAFLVVLLLVALPRGGSAQGDPAMSCLQQLETNPRFAPLADKMALTDVNTITFAMLASEGKPTPNERTLIAAVAGEYQRCFQAGDAWRQQHYLPQVTAILTEALHQGLAVTTELYQGKVTYGAYNKRRQGIAAEASTRIATNVQQVQLHLYTEHLRLQQAREAQQAAQHQAMQAQRMQEEAVRRQLDAQRAAQLEAVRAYEEAAHRLARTQFFLSLLRPRSIDTTCTRLGDFLNCTSR